MNRKQINKTIELLWMLYPRKEDLEKVLQKEEDQLIMLLSRLNVESKITMFEAIFLIDLFRIGKEWILSYGELEKENGPE